MREPGAAAGIVAAREHVLQVGERETLVDRVRPPHRVHDPVAAREHEPALRPRGRLDRRHRRTRVVPAGDDALERPDQAVLGRVGQQPPAGAEVDRLRLIVAATAREQHRGRDERRGAERRGKQEEGGPARAALPFLVLLYLIVNVALPVVWFPAMSVASQRNSVVVETTNDWPGSRGPVESQSVDVLLGFDPSVVYRITAGSFTYLNVVVIGVLDERAPGHDHLGGLVVLRVVVGRLEQPVVAGGELERLELALGRVVRLEPDPALRRVLPPHDRARPRARTGAARRG